MLRLRYAASLSYSTRQLKWCTSKNSLTGPSKGYLGKIVWNSSSASSSLFEDDENNKKREETSDYDISKLRQVLLKQENSQGISRQKFNKPKSFKNVSHEKRDSPSGDRLRNIQQQNERNNIRSGPNRKSRNSRHRNNRKSSTSPPKTTTKEKFKSDGIESLRAVFLKSVELDRERREKEMEQDRNISAQTSSSSPSHSGNNSTLFKTLATDRSKQQPDRNKIISEKSRSTWRETNTVNTRHSNEGSIFSNWREAQKTNKIESPNSSSTFYSPKEQFMHYQHKRKGFFDTKLDHDRKLEQKKKLNAHRQKHAKKRSTQRQKQIILANHPTEVDLRSLAGILRVKIEQITKTLISLGELDASVLETPVKPDFIDKRGKRKPKKKSKESLVSVGDRIIDIDMAELVAMELGFDVTRSDNGVSSLIELEDPSMIGRRNISDEVSEDDTIVADDVESEVKFQPRAPVVSIMGHVDHGKTTLMDALRRRSNLSSASNKKKRSKTKVKKKKNGQDSKHSNGGDVAGTEAGGITQVISAFEVPIHGMELESLSGRNSVTFLDTPGHAAFKSMRQSGSNATDIVVLVVAADDGVSAQTVEIIDMFKRIEKESGGNISLLVAMTKIDKEGVNVEEATRRIENQLMEHEIFSNNVQMVPVSGLTGEGLDDLVESLVLQAQVMDLKADLEARGEGVVLDAKMQKGLGVVVDCVVRWGNLQKGDVIISGNHMGKVKILTDVNGKAIKKALASQPIRLVGLKTLPKAGDPLICVKDEETAKEIIEHRLASSNEVNLHRAELSSSNQDDLQITGSAAKEFNSRKRVLNRYGLDTSNNGDDENEEAIYIPVVIKADADGSLDAVKESLLSIGIMSENYSLNIDPIEASIGVITPNDLQLAKESQAPIFSFGVKGGYDRKAAIDAGVTIREHEVIYSLLDDARDIFAENLPRVESDKVHGRAIVQAVFTLSGKLDEKIAGLKVREGVLLKEKCPDTGLSCKYRVLRDGKLICTEEGISAASLRKVKEDVQNVKKGEECGLGLQSFSDLIEGDVIECFSIEMKKATI